MDLKLSNTCGTEEYNPDEEIILEFLNIFTKLFLRKKIALLVRIIKNCTVEEDIKITLRGLNTALKESDKEKRDDECTDALNHLKTEMDLEYDAFFINDLVTGDQTRLDSEQTEVQEPNHTSSLNSRNTETQSSISSEYSDYVTEYQSRSGPKHKVPEDLQALIISSNPHHEIQFTYSQRMNTQMVVSGHVLKKKRGPYIAPSSKSSGHRTINWKCVVDTCSYYAVTLEGTFKDNELKKHNHEKQPDLLAKKEARLKLRKKIENGEVASEKPISHFVMDTVMKETQPEMLGMIGSISSLKQAANRYKKNMSKSNEVVDSVFVDPSEDVDQMKYCINCTNGSQDTCEENDCFTRKIENPIDIFKNEIEIS